MGKGRCIMARLLKEGDTYKEGDLYLCINIWKPIPPQWYGMKFSHKDDNTLSRQKIPVKRMEDV